MFGPIFEKVSKGFNPEAGDKLKDYKPWLYWSSAGWNLIAHLLFWVGCVATLLGGLGIPLVGAGVGLFHQRWKHKKWLALRTQLQAVA